MMRPGALQRMGSMALALVLALLAHDLLMASEAGADAPSGSHQHHAAGLSTTNALPSDSSHFSIAPLHPDGCSPAMPAVSSQKAIKSGPGVSDQVASGTNWVEPISLSLPAHPPTRPPAARRALFQVYRI
jgi:hypothetical protein